MASMTAAVTSGGTAGLTRWGRDAACRVEVFDADMEVKPFHARFLFAGVISEAGTPQAPGKQSLSAKLQQLSVRKPSNSFIREKFGL